MAFTPRVGTIQNSIDVIKIKYLDNRVNNRVNIRRDFSTMTMNTVASILEDRAIEHRNLADTAKTKLKERYSEEVALEGQPPAYSYEDAKTLVANLIERESPSLNRKLRSDKYTLQKCPEAALWVGVPIALVPGNNIANHTPRPTKPTTGNTGKPTQANTNPPNSRVSDALASAPPALFSDALQLGKTRPKNRVDQISPLVPKNSQPTRGVLPHPGADDRKIVGHQPDAMSHVRTLRTWTATHPTSPAADGAPEPNDSDPAVLPTRTLAKL